MRTHTHTTHTTHTQPQPHPAARRSSTHAALCDLHDQTPANPATKPLNPSREEIVNACGVDDLHDGVNYVRTAVVIAVSKARDYFEPFMHQVGALCVALCVLFFTIEAVGCGQALDAGLLRALHAPGG